MKHAEKAMRAVCLCLLCVIFSSAAWAQNTQNNNATLLKGMEMTCKDLRAKFSASEGEAPKTRMSSAVQVVVWCDCMPKQLAYFKGVPLDDKAKFMQAIEKATGFCTARFFREGVSDFCKSDPRINTVEDSGAYCSCLHRGTESLTDQQLMDMANSYAAEHSKWTEAKARGETSPEPKLGVWEQLQNRCALDPQAQPTPAELGITTAAGDQISPHEIAKETVYCSMFAINYQRFLKEPEKGKALVELTSSRNIPVMLGTGVRDLRALVNDAVIVGDKEYQDLIKTPEAEFKDAVAAYVKQGRDRCMALSKRPEYNSALERGKELEKVLRERMDAAKQQAPE